MSSLKQIVHRLIGVHILQQTLQLQPDLSVSFLNGLYRWMKAQFIPLGILFGS